MDKSGPKRETKAEKSCRYEAQVIAAEYGMSLSDAMEMARISLGAKTEKGQRSRSNKQKERHARALRRQQGESKDGYIYVTHGPPMSGGAPGLGKRR